ncbi:MAG: hypothetical protein IPM42_21180 [Saprospiraceae bacterium]|nr:hypothetical protein [Saprospiraceae bacterium]
MNIISSEFNQFLFDIIESGIKDVWLSYEENVEINYGEDYSHCNDSIWEIYKNLVIQTNSFKYYEFRSEYSNAEYVVEINSLNIKSITELTTYFEEPIKYSKFERLSNKNIRLIKPELQFRIIEDIKIRSISFYSEEKFEFAIIGKDNLQTHKDLDRPLFDGCWLILNKNIIEMNK